MKRGAVEPLTIAALTSVSIVGSVIAVLLQGAGSLTTPDIIMMFVNVITIPAMVGLYFEIKGERKAREAALEQAREAREKLAAHEAERRGEVHGRINALMQAMAESAKKDGVELGRLVERVDNMRNDITGFGLRMEGFASKVSNQAEKAWESRTADFDRRVSRLEHQLLDTPRDGG